MGIKFVNDDEKARLERVKRNTQALAPGAKVKSKLVRAPSKAEVRVAATKLLAKGEFGPASKRTGKTVSGGGRGITNPPIVAAGAPVPISLEEFLTRLRASIAEAGSATLWATYRNLSYETIRMVIAKERLPGPAVLKAMGYEAVAFYVEIPK